MARGLRALPAHPWTVAAYVRFCQSRHRPKTITGKVETIVRAHIFKGHTSPGKSLILKRTLKLVASGVVNPPAKRRTLFVAKDFAKPAPSEKKDAAKAPPGKTKRQLRKEPRLVTRKPR